MLRILQRRHHDGGKIIPIFTKFAFKSQTISEGLMTNSDNWFDLLVSNLGTAKVNEILYNWNGSELDDERRGILIYVDERAYGPRTGGFDVVDSTEFRDWLTSDEPFNAGVYEQDQEWVEVIKEARSAIARPLDSE